MSTFSVAEAKDRLSALISAAEAGETVTITRHGKPVAEIRRASANLPKMSSAESIEWIRQLTAHIPKPPITGAEIVRMMRDED